jgi:hypothetical protein
MEIKLSLLMLVVLAGVTLSLMAGTPEALIAPDAAAAAELAQLEDDFAGRPDELSIATRLSGEYLRMGEPALAIGVVHRASPALLADPLLTHRLAQAYEAVGRLDDALVTASVARTRCLRAVGTSSLAPSPTAVSFDCTPAALVAIERHEDALIQMLRWGVSDPRRDGRARLAHRLAARHARILSAQR